MVGFRHGAFVLQDNDGDYGYNRLKEGKHKEGDMGCQMAPISLAFSFPHQEG